MEIRPSILYNAGMGMILDSTVLIDYERGRLDLPGKIAAHPERDWFLSVITASELVHGTYRDKTKQQRNERLVFVEAMLKAFPIIPIDEAAARVHGRISADLVNHGLCVGSHDQWIAATCIVHNHTIATSNVRDYRHVPGLKVGHW
jgi:tRNA(fMet)-specific endonuclease VapC